MEALFVICFVVFKLAFIYGMFYLVYRGAKSIGRDAKKAVQENVRVVYVQQPLRAQVIEVRDVR